MDTEVQITKLKLVKRQLHGRVSPRDIASALNERDIPGLRGKAWRDTAIRGHKDRGSGILNNETYIGLVIWNRRNYRKNPDTERRVARHNDSDTWVVNEVPELRIVSDDLWAKVKARQKEVGELFARTTSNRLNASHRPSYLLSGILECAECISSPGRDLYKGNPVGRPR